MDIFAHPVLIIDAEDLMPLGFADIYRPSDLSNSLPSSIPLAAVEVKEKQEPSKRRISVA